ncbi:LLM class flavin-dependent oxidoreductase [Dongia sp.]|uniref:LLM class flavin-dependent oxidoreductase n=1 Tax=Dongia sp. TaxID=1977262 RepID=UPI0035B25193
MIPFSVLDLSPIPEGLSAADAFRNSADLARHAEDWGYHRFWLAEHHNMPGIASAATSVVIGHVAAATKRIRVGAGGIMLPNHAPLVIAEQFGTLESLFPGRIDLGLGRAPGTDQRTARALRRNLLGSDDSFPQDVAELMGWFAPVEPGQAIRAVPGAGLDIPIWLLGSSLFSAQLAAEMGLPFAFASHFAPDSLLRALDLYRSRFKPSVHLAKPYVMAGLSVVAAETDAEAKWLFTSLQQQFVNLRRGRPGPLPPPRDDMESFWSPLEKEMVDHSLAYAVVGSQENVERGLVDFMTGTAVDEIMVAGQIFDHQARLKSFKMVADIRTKLAGGPGALGERSASER